MTYRLLHRISPFPTRYGSKRLPAGVFGLRNIALQQWDSSSRDFGASGDHGFTAVTGRNVPTADPPAHLLARRCGQYSIPAHATLAAGSARQAVYRHLF
jgi:hypothetical protein